MLVAATMMLGFYLAAPIPSVDESRLGQALAAANVLNAGNALCILSLWTVPGLYDAGIFTMMGAKKSLKGQYIARYGEDATAYEESGDAAYWRGWASEPSRAAIGPAPGNQGRFRILKPAVLSP